MLDTNNTRKLYRIASIPGDGIGPEVISAGVTVLNTLAFSLNTFDLRFEHFDWNSNYYKQHGTYLPKDALKILKEFDAILFGSVGDPGMVLPRSKASKVMNNDNNNNNSPISRCS